ncbi:MAG: Hsp20/alpha crystallin family protein [Nitrosopumilaceae archaeon]
MAKPKKTTKQTTGVTPFSASWGEFDKVFDNFRRDLEKSFTSFPSFSMPSFPKLTETSCDVIDEGNHFLVRVDIPGVKKNDIKLNVTENAVEISAENTQEKEEKKKNYLRKERKEVSHYRTIPLSEKVISGKVKAKLTDGVLAITLPKLKPGPVSKKKAVTVQ